MMTRRKFLNLSAEIEPKLGSHVKRPQQVRSCKRLVIPKYQPLVKSTTDQHLVTICCLDMVAAQ